MKINKENSFCAALNFLLLLFLTCGVQTGYAADSVAAKKIVCIGDSITFGTGLRNARRKRDHSYPRQLSTMLGEKYQVLNLGVGGMAMHRGSKYSYWRKPHYKTALESKPDIVIIMLGTNDSNAKVWKNKETFEKDYLAMIESFQKLESKPQIWICTAIPALSGRFGVREEYITRDINPIIKDLAGKTKVNLIDMYQLFKNQQGIQGLYSDTIHPNSKGAKLLADAVKKAIQK